MIGKINRVPLREVWKREDLDFTTWLEDNIDILNEILDLNLSGAEREKSAGAFKVDLIAEDNEGNLVVIENQLGKSDHDHLGKLITYLTAIGAKIAIWIVSDPRTEHINAITWLNESLSASFYLIKVEAIKIGDSKPAPLLTLIVGPSEEGRVAGETKKDLAERFIIRRKFWTMLLEYLKSRTKLHSNIAPTNDNWIGTGAGRQGLSFNYSITKHESQVELYIDRGKDSEEENKAIFEEFFKSIQKIEHEFGERLEWQRLDGKRACRIRKKITIGGYRDDEEKWPKIHEAMVDSMISLEEALRPNIKKLKI